MNSSGSAVRPALEVARPAKPSLISRWSYPEQAGSRDLRIDFLRGLAVFALVINHIEIFSAFNLLTWERIGVVTGAEGFVIFAGVVLGSVHRKRIQEQGWSASFQSLLDRSLQLYRVNICVVASIGLLSGLRFLDMRGAMTFVDRGAGITYPLYPAPGTNWHTTIAKLLFLQFGPHQTQILGLYIVLLAISPLVFLALRAGRVRLVLALSWALYFYNWAFPAMPTGAQFEYGFPVLTWQLIFFHGLCFGYYKQEIAAWFTPRRKTLALIVAYALFFGFLFFTLNNPYPALPPWDRLSWMAPATFNRVYSAYFLKNSLGILRLVNCTLVLVVTYHVLSLFWKGLNKLLGWFFLPLGQASLYVFILHVYGLVLLYNLPMFKGLVPVYSSPLRQESRQHHRRRHPQLHSSLS